MSIQSNKKIMNAFFAVTAFFLLTSVSKADVAVPLSAYDAAFSNSEEAMTHILNDPQYRKPGEVAATFTDVGSTAFNFLLTRDGHTASVTVQDHPAVGTDANGNRTYTYNFTENVLGIDPNWQTQLKPPQWFRATLHPNGKVTVASSLDTENIVAKIAFISKTVPLKNQELNDNMENYMDTVVAATAKSYRDKEAADAAAHTTSHPAGAVVHREVAPAIAQSSAAANAAVAAPTAPAVPVVVSNTVTVPAQPVKPTLAQNLHARVASVGNYVHQTVQRLTPRALRPKPAAAQPAAQVSAPATVAKASSTSAIQTSSFVRNQFFDEANRNSSWTDKTTGITINGSYELKEGKTLDDVTVYNLFSKYAEIVDSKGKSSFISLATMKSEIASTIYDPSQSLTENKSYTDNPAETSDPSAVASLNQSSAN